MLYGVKKKTSLMNLKIKPEVHLEFKVAAELRGSTMSNLLHQFIVQTIHEEKKKHPDDFPKLLKLLIAEDSEPVEIVDAEDATTSDARPVAKKKAGKG